MGGKAATPARASGLGGGTGELELWGGSRGARGLFAGAFAGLFFPAEPGPPASVSPLVTTPGLRAPGRRRRRK